MEVRHCNRKIYILTVLQSSKRSQLINESVEAGLVMASGTWDDVDGQSDSSAPSTPKRGRGMQSIFCKRLLIVFIDPAAITALRAKRSVYLDKLKKTSIDRFIKDFLKRKIPPKQQAEMTVSFLGEISSYQRKRRFWFSFV